MKGKIEVSVYQHPTFEEGNFVFQVNPLATLLEQCRKLYEKKIQFTLIQLKKLSVNSLNFFKLFH